MEVQATRRPKCSKIEYGDVGNSEPVSKSFKHKLLGVLKRILVRLLVRPVVLKWLLVHVPIVIEKVEHMLKDIFELFIDLF